MVVHTKFRTLEEEDEEGCCEGEEEEGQKVPTWLDSFGQSKGLRMYDVGGAISILSRRVETTEDAKKVAAGLPGTCATASG